MTHASPKVPRKTPAASASGELPVSEGRLESLPAPGDFLVRVAGLLSGQADPSAIASAFLSELGLTLRMRAWLACRDFGSEKVYWLPEGLSAPFPAALAGDERSLLYAAVNQGRRTILADIEAAGEFPERRHLHRKGAEGCALLPLEAGGQTFGCVVLAFPRGEALGAERLRILEPSLPVVALSLRGCLLQREMEAGIEERTAEIALLYDISSSLGFVLSAEDLFEKLESSLPKALSFDLCGLLLLHGSREGTLHISATADDRAARKFRRIVLAEAERLVGRKLSRITSSMKAGGGDRGEASERPLEIRAAAHIPLLLHGQMHGVLSVASREAGAFGERPTRLLYTIGNHVLLTLDRLRATREAESSRIHSVLESMAEGVLLLDHGLRLVMANPAALKYLATIRGGRHPSALVRLGDCDLGQLMKEMEGGEAKVRTFEIAAPSEGKVFSLTCSPVQGPSDSVEGMVAVLSDITEARNLQLQFAQSEKLSSLGEMISGVAHELNNPLGSVIGYAQLLQREEVDEDISRKLAAICEEAARCRKIVQDLLRFARPHTPERRLLDINGAVESVLQLLGHQFHVDDIPIEVDLDPGMPGVLGDFHLLQQVFVNIIYNAHQALKARGGPGRIRARSFVRDGRVVVEIQDNGPGIEPENLKRIFDPFFTTKEVGRGTGLGLSLAHSTVRQHGGTLLVTSRPGEGATFVVELPASPGTMQAVGSTDRVAETGPPAASASRMDGKRILVVEDEGHLADVMVEALEAHGLVVETAGNGRAAKQRVSSRAYDLIISDLKMPQMNGREFYRYVAAAQPALARRIIFSTGDTASPETQAFFEEVGNPFLAKPFNLTELIRVVDSVLARS